jgi:hypothetical protein
MNKPTPTKIAMRNAATLMQIDLNMLQAELSADEPNPDTIWGKAKRIDFLAKQLQDLSQHQPTPDLLGMLTDLNPATCAPQQ